ncbi:MAG: hypothetical protein HGA36_03170 [Candidatus Moranbacteria bacterium]|nr:hypothetical protein [Candidatus Moranbacteria bacterium]
MSIEITFILDEEDVEMQEKVAAFVSQYPDKIQMMETRSADNIDFSKVMAFATYSEEPRIGNMVARIMVAANDSRSLVVDDFSKQVGIVGFDSSQDLHISRILMNDLLIQDAEIIPKNHREGYPSFAQIRKFPIPAQCKKANIIISKR